MSPMRGSAVATASWAGAWRMGAGGALRWGGGGAFLATSGVLAGATVPGRDGACGGTRAAGGDTLAIG